MSNDRFKNGPQTTIMAGIPSLDGEVEAGATIAFDGVTDTPEKPSPDVPSSGVGSAQSDRLGRYIKLDLLGVGGMGEVFRSGRS